MKLKIAIILCVIALCIGIGHKTVINVERENVKATLIRGHYRNEWYESTDKGEVYHPEPYTITAYCNNEEFHIADKETYIKYSRRIGEVVNGTLNTYTYSNGTTEKELILTE